MDDRKHETDAMGDAGTVEKTESLERSSLVPEEEKTTALSDKELGLVSGGAGPSMSDIRITKHIDK